MPNKVTDPALLEKLKGSGGAAASGKKVTDPELLKKLKGGPADDEVDDADLVDFVSEGMSGVNEGIADLASLPAQALTALLSLGPMAANAMGVDAKYPDYVPDPGENARDLMTTVGAIKPASDDPRLQVTRRIGREIGRNALPVQASVMRAAQPIRTLISEGAMTLGSGGGAAIANQVAPGNAAAEIAGQVLGGGIASLGTTLGRKAVTPLPASPERIAAADRMAAEGVTLSAGQRTGSKGMKYAESELGGGAVEALTERQAEQFTRAALARAGVRADRATPEVINRAYDDIGQEFDDLVAGTTIQADRQLGQELGDIQRQFNELTGDATRPTAVQNRINDIVAKVQQNNGTIPGDTYKAMRTEIDTLARGSSNPELKMALGDVRTALDDAVERTLAASNSPLTGQWRDVRGRYRNLVIVTDAATRAGENAALGLISPAALRSAAALNVGKRSYARGQSDLGELGRDGTATMTPMPQSGTAPRQAVRNLSMGVPAAVGAVLGNNAMPGVGAVLGGAAGALVPKAMGAAVLSAPGRAYLGNQAMRPRLDPRGIGMASGVTMTLTEYQKNRPLEITVNGGAN